MSSVIVTIQHLYSVPAWNGRSGFCGDKSRVWFAKHGLDWSDFVFNGISSDVLESTGDALAIHLVEFARAEVANGQ